MNKKHTLQQHDLLMTGDELIAWAQRTNQDAGKQREAQEHFLTCDDCELDFDGAVEPADVSATPCPAYFKLVEPTDEHSAAVWPGGRSRLDRPDTKGRISLVVPINDRETAA